MGLFSWLFGGNKTVQIAKMEKKATALKKENPDAAIKILQQVITLQRQVGIPLYGQLQTRLRMATVMYENKRFDNAENFLLTEYVNARRWVIGKHEFDIADKKYHERIRTTKKYSGKLEDFECKREGEENADFNRNLYCLRIYEKLRTCYEHAKKFEKALPFAVAEAYAKYENNSHNMYCDDPQLDLKIVEKFLAKMGRLEMMQYVQAVLEKYAQKPDSTKCWRMIDEIQKYLASSNA